jgi:hypothetical protein
MATYSTISLGSQSRELPQASTEIHFETNYAVGVAGSASDSFYMTMPFTTTMADISNTNCPRIIKY